MRNQKKWFDLFIGRNFTGISVASMAVFGEDVEVKVDRPIFIDPKRRTKVSLEANEGKSKYISWIFKKIEGFNPEYHEINFRFPGGAELGRESEAEPFDIRNMDKDYGYCFLRSYQKSLFEDVYIRIGRWNYKVSVIEKEDAIEVILWNNPKDIPDCLR